MTPSEAAEEAVKALVATGEVMIETLVAEIRVVEEETGRRPDEIAVSPDEPEEGDEAMSITQHDDMSLCPCCNSYVVGEHQASCQMATRPAMTKEDLERELLQALLLINRLQNYAHIHKQEHPGWNGNRSDDIQAAQAILERLNSWKQRMLTAGR